MSVQQMRALLYKQYGGAYKWVNRVKAMSDNQIIAVYHRMLGAGKFRV